MIRSAPILTISRFVLLGLMGATLLTAVVSLLVLGSTFFVDGELIVHARRETVALRWVMFIALLGLSLVWILFTQLLAIVKTVSAGDPFISENARRLTMLAWTMLALQFILLVLQPLADILFGTDQETEWSFSITGWLAVLLLFVLARVFDEGTRMREELEGTV